MELSKGTLFIWTVILLYCYIKRQLNLLFHCKNSPNHGYYYQRLGLCKSSFLLLEYFIEYLLEYWMDNGSSY